MTRKHEETALTLSHSEHARDRAKANYTATVESLEDARRDYLLARGWTEVESPGRRKFRPPVDRSGPPWVLRGSRIHRPAYLAVRMERKHQEESGG